MMNINFSKEELTEFKIREIFESFHYRRKHLNKFEEYALYEENKDFIATNNVITFSDANGRLLALKPDITLSVIKAIPEKPMVETERIYYVDEVFRFSRKAKEFKVKKQVGAELIGSVDGRVQLEIIDLSLQCLKAIGENYLLDISHQSFIKSFLGQCCLPVHIEKELLGYMNNKNIHDIERLFSRYQVPEKEGEGLIRLSGLSGNLHETLPQVKELVFNKECEDAYKELEMIDNAFRAPEYRQRLYLDFSVINHMDYYDGLVFLGYVEGKVSEVLSGGRYDKLLRKMNKNNNAIGFGIYMSNL